MNNGEKPLAPATAKNPAQVGNAISCSDNHGCEAPAITKSQKPPKLIVPKDPVQIGKTADGQPIWFESKDLIPTPEEDQERWDKTLDGRQQAMIDTAAHVVLSNACEFIQRTVLSTCGSIEKLHAAITADHFVSYLQGEGYSTIQDGLKTVVKKRGRVLREMTAHIPARWQKHVARRVDQIVRDGRKAAATLN